MMGSLEAGEETDWEGGKDCNWSDLPNFIDICSSNIFVHRLLFAQGKTSRLSAHSSNYYLGGSVVWALFPFDPQ